MCKKQKRPRFIKQDRFYSLNIMTDRVSQADGFGYVGGGLIGTTVGYHADIAELLVTILVVERKNSARKVVGRKITRDDILDDVIALFACKHEQGLMAIPIFQRQRAADINGDNRDFTALNNGIYLLRLSTEIISAIHCGLKKTSLLYSGNELLVREEAIMSIRLARAARTPWPLPFPRTTSATSWVTFPSVAAVPWA